MLQATFDILLEQPLIISQQAASAGAHQSLDFIPGSALLGLAASRLYADLDAGSAWTLFHSGQVRFGDALPLRSGDVGYPVPFCWHTYKGEPAQDKGQLLAENLFDPSRYNTDEARQPVQMRAGYTTESGQLLTPERQQTLKTAIDRKTGMAAESQLFGYEALASGQRYRFTLSADTEVAPALWQQLQDSMSGTAHLGRSRSAQFGRVQIDQQPAYRLHPSSGAGNTLTLWLLSDLLLEDQGQPCLIPHPHLLGLPQDSRWLAEQSFLRSRRYSTYNAYRRSYDSERQVICRGSVVRYALARPLSVEECLDLQKGLGLQIESGLGSVWVNPPLLAQEQPQFARVQASQVIVSSTPPQPETLLITALRARQQRRLGDVVPEQQARLLFSGLCQRIRDARRYAATAIGVPIAAPGRSQWGRLKQMASGHRNTPDQLWNDLTNARDGLLRERSGWDLRYGPEPDQQLDNWMHEALQQYRQQVYFSRLIGHLAVLGLQQAWLDCCAGTDSEGAEA